MLRQLRIWLNRPLAEALEALEGRQCALSRDYETLSKAWKEAETNLDGTYRRVHSELGYIDKRSADLRKLEQQHDLDENSETLHGPFAGGRMSHGTRRAR